MTLQKLLHAGSHYLCDAGYRFLLHARLGLHDRMPDETYLPRLYRAAFGCAPDLQAPQTFNEKLQWLKLHDRRPEYTVMADKLLAKDYVTGLLGPGYTVPTLGSWKTPEEIDFDALPNQFVLKCNHNSGLGMYICRDKRALTPEKIRHIRKNLRKGLREDYYLHAREWPYRDIPRRILAEAFLDGGSSGLTDYKIHNFGGEAKLILVCRDRFTASGLTEDFYTPSWELLDLHRPAHPNSADPLPRPAELEQMLALSARLSQGIPFVRTDFYIVNHQVLFSELTFFPAAGFEKFVPERWDQTLGSWLRLPTDA